MTGHPQTTLERYGYAADVDEGVAVDVLRLWRRRIPTFASCQGDSDDGHRYIGCAKKLTVRRAHDVAVALGWVDHVVWHHGRTVFYSPSPMTTSLRANDGVLLLPRVVLT